MLKLNVRRGAGASTGGILCSASGSAADGRGRCARGRSCRGQCSPLRLYRQAAVTRSGAPQAPDGGDTTGATTAAFRTVPSVNHPTG